MPVQFRFIAAFVCKDVIEDKNGALSAIRIIEIVDVPESLGNDPIFFTVVVILKALPAVDAEIRVGLSLVAPNNGGRKRLVDGASGPPRKLQIFESDPSIPSGVKLIFDFNVKPRLLGTWIAEIDVDGEVIASAPFTLRRLPSSESIG